MKGLVVSILLAVGFFAFVAVQANRPVGLPPKALLFVVAKGDGPQTIATRLADAGLIRSRTLFLWTVWSRGDRGKFQAGSYELSPSMTTREIESALASGKPVSNEREVRIIEGWTLRDIADYLEKEGLASKKAFAAEAGESAKPAAGRPDWSASYPELADRPASASLEGYLFPDTYRVYAGGGVKALVRRMLENFESKLTPDLRAEIAVRHHGVFEVVIMASIIEREVRSDEDRALVSDIFWRRIGIGEGLQADSTVNYATGKSEPSAGAEDLSVDSPWNTYKYRGLPAGPIGNPGLSALKAAIEPKANEFWYFLTDRQGNVHYAKTLEEHNANKAKYLR